MSDPDHLCNSDAVCEILAPSTKCGSIWHSFGLDPMEFDGVHDNERLSYGVPGFDNFGQALLTVF